MSAGRPGLSRSVAAAGPGPNRKGATSVTTTGGRGRHDKLILEGPILPVLLKLASPTIIVMMAQTGVNVAEAFYVGLLGTDAIAAVALVFPIFMLMTMMSAGGVGSGVASAIARATGAGLRHQADDLVLHSLIFAVFIGALFTAGMIGLGPSLYRALGGTGIALQTALDYSTAVFAGSVPLWVVNLLAAALRGSGNVKLPAQVTLVGAIILVPVSPLLIFGLGPLPGFGIAGAGIAFALYYTGAAVVLLRKLSDGTGDLALRRGRLQLRLFKDILKVGLPAGFITVLTNLTVILVTGAYGHFGTDALAGYGAASRLDYVLVPLLFGLASAVLTMVGINIGAGQGERARRVAIVGSVLAFAATQTIGLVVAIRPGLWLHLYTDEPAVLATGSTYLRLVGLAYGVFGFGFVLAFAAQGAGRLFWPVCAVVARAIIGAGLGWLSVSAFDVSASTLAGTIAMSLFVYGAGNAIILGQRHIWRSRLG